MIFRALELVRAQSGTKSLAASLALALGGACNSSGKDGGPLDQSALSKKNPAAMQAIQLAVKSNVSAALQACGLALHARAPLTNRIDYSVVLTVAASDGNGQLVAVDGNLVAFQHSQHSLPVANRTGLRPSRTGRNFWNGTGQSFRNPQEPIDTSIKFVASSKSQKGRVSEVKAGTWPTEFDDPMKECVMNAFSGIEFDTDAYEFSYELDYPLRLAPPPRDPATWPEGSRLYQDGGSSRQPR